MVVVRWFFYLVVFLGLALGAAYLYAPYNNGPLEIFPGGEMTGPAGTETNWEFASDYGMLDLELRPDDPYSVRLNYIYRDGNVYIDPMEGRTWFEYLKKNQDVRVRFDKDIYKAKAVLVTDEAEKEGMDPTRVIYRLEMVK